MNALPSSCEIVELVDVDSSSIRGSKSQKDIMLENGKNVVDKDINRLFEVIIRSSSRNSDQQVSRDALWRKAMKKPMRTGSSPSSRVGGSESVSLKQALRGICISQASELAAMKRMSKLRNPGSVEVWEHESVGRVYKSMVSETLECSYRDKEGIQNMVDISLIPENNASSISMNQSIHFPMARMLDPGASTSTAAIATMSKVRMTEKLRQPGKVKLHAENGTAKPQIGFTLNEKAAEALDRFRNTKIVNSGDTVPSSVQTAPGKGLEVDTPCVNGTSDLCARSKSSKTAQFMKPLFWNKNHATKKVDKEQDPCSSSDSCSRPNIEVKPNPNWNALACQIQNRAPTKNRKEELIACPLPNTLHQTEDSFNLHAPSSRCTTKLKSCKSRSRGTGGFSQSSKSSIGDFSCSTSISGESCFSWSSGSSRRPHMFKDFRWEAIHYVQKLYGNVSLSHFKLLRKLGCGDIGTVYLAELRGTNCLFAVKVMDNKFLVSMDKMLRAQTEREIMQMLDHPFLPTLYAHSTTDKFSCLVMEYCRGGDMHVLRQLQPNRNFCEQAARNKLLISLQHMFYVAEVLLALEYLHLQGVVYRDLKPENILVREDGHIMLTDFDLSSRCSVNPTLVKSLSLPASISLKKFVPCIASTCIHPFRLQPSWQVRRFSPKISSAAKTKKLKSDPAAQVTPMPQLVVEPVDARANSFVGTHEYLAPEVIKGEGHGSAVDWWTYGILIYELLYGKTPFKGPSNEDTLANVVSQSLEFPDTPIVSFHSRDLIRRLLVKEPDNRLGFTCGAAEIKQHSFFQDLNWALIRCAVPPKLPCLSDTESVTVTDDAKCPRELFKQF